MPDALPVAQPKVSKQQKMIFSRHVLDLGKYGQIWLRKDDLLDFQFGCIWRISTKLD